MKTGTIPTMTATEDRMKHKTLWLLLIILLLLPFTITVKAQEVGDPLYWEKIIKSRVVPAPNGDPTDSSYIRSFERWQRLPDRWTVTIKYDTGYYRVDCCSLNTGVVIDTLADGSNVCWGYSIRVDTTYTPKIVGFFTPAEWKKLQDWLHPKPRNAALIIDVDTMPTKIIDTCDYIPLWNAIEAEVRKGGE